MSSSSNEIRRRRRRRNRHRRHDDIDIPFNNQNLLTSIAASGVLLKPIDNASSTLDLVFVLNVRESELYPPLFQSDDVKCVQEKLQNLQNGFVSSMYISATSRVLLPHIIDYVFRLFIYLSAYSKEDLVDIEKQFMKQCLEQRLPNIQPHKAKFESQIVVTRLSITCSCMSASEKCSTFNTIDKQKWTEFMGDLNTGFY